MNLRISGAYTLRQLSDDWVIRWSVVDGMVPVRLGRPFQPSQPPVNRMSRGYGGGKNDRPTGRSGINARLRKSRSLTCRLAVAAMGLHYITS